MKDNKHYLVLFSGGKDSFITTCRLVMRGCKVSLISYNSAGEIGEEHLRFGANRLIKRYGIDKVNYIGSYGTYPIISTLNDNWTYFSYKELGEKYPNLTNCQVQCLHCQTAMWIASIAYCLAKNIEYIASGYKKIDVFCTGSTEYIEKIKSVAQEYNINIELPVWDSLDEGIKRDMEMENHRFLSSVLEPKCLIGRKPKNGLSIEEHSDMLKYFDDEVYPKMKKEIEILIPIFKTIKIFDRSYDFLDYPEIDSSIYF